MKTNSNQRKNMAARLGLEDNGVVVIEAVYNLA